MRTTPTALLTLAFGLSVTLAAFQTDPAAGKTMTHATVKKKAVKKPVKAPASSAALIALGKTTAETNGCNSCHTGTYAGKPGFSPSIRANGVTAKYSSAQFVRLIHDGTTEDGGHVRKPMPVYPQIPAKNSAALYAFLKSQK